MAQGLAQGGGWRQGEEKLNAATPLFKKIDDEDINAEVASLHARAARMKGERAMSTEETPGAAAGNGENGSGTKNRSGGGAEEAVVATQASAEGMIRKQLAARAVPHF